MAPKRSGASVGPKPRDIINPEMAAVRGDPLSTTNNIICSTVDTSSEDTTASLKQKTVAMATKVMRCEERNIFFGDLIRVRLGTREVDNFISKQERLRRGEGNGGMGEYEIASITEREREMVLKAMENKLADSLAEGVKKRQELIKLKQRLWWRLKKEEERRKMNNRIRDEVGRLRIDIN